MKILYLLIIAILVSVSYDYYTRYTELYDNDIIRFYITYDIISVEDCTEKGCEAIVQQSGENKQELLFIKSLSSMPFIIRKPVVRQCSNVISTKVVTCEKDLRSLEDLELKYAKHKDWDLRPAASQIIYQ